MGNRHWPMFDLRLTTPDLQLRHLQEADLASLAAILPEDAEQDPSSTSYPVLMRTGIGGLWCTRTTGERAAPGARSRGR